MAIYYKIILACLLTLLPLRIDKARPLKTDSNDTISFGIVTDYGMYRKQGLPMGFQYRLMEKFSEQNRYSMEVLPLGQDPWLMLVNNELDVLVVDTHLDTIPSAYKDKFSISAPIRAVSWVTNNENKYLSNLTNFWIGSFTKTEDYLYLEYVYFKDPNKHSISPYDKLIKENCKTLGWDWRLLSALIYQESKFRMGSYSQAGAIGLMQIKPTTAQHYGFSNIFSPPSNILAGTSHLNFLKKEFQRKGLDSLNTIKYTLAAYNAGQGRIGQCMKYAEYLGEDSKNWESLEKVIPQMRYIEKSISDSLGVRRFHGDETLSYVNSILSHYEYYASFTER